MKLADLRRLSEAAELAFTRDRVALGAVRARQAALVQAGEDEAAAESREIEAAASDPASAMNLIAYRVAADARRRARIAAAATLEEEAAAAIAVAAGSFRKTQAVAFLERRAREEARREALKQEEEALAQFVSLRSTIERSRAERRDAAAALAPVEEPDQQADYREGGWTPSDWVTDLET